MPERAVAEGLVEALADVPAERVLVPARGGSRRAARRAPRARRAGRRARALPRRSPSRSTTPPGRAAASADYLLFTSASSVRFFAEAAVTARSTARGWRAIGPATSAALRERGRRAAPRGRAAHAPTVWSPPSCWPTRLTAPDHVPVRLRPGRRVRRRRPRRDRAGLPGRAGDRPRPRRPAPGRAGGSAMLDARAPVRAAGRPPRGRRPGGRRGAAGGRAAHRGGGPAARRPRQRPAPARRRALRRHAEAVEISASPWRLEPVSATFHGRDLFAPGGRPARARRAAGGGRARRSSPAELVTLELPAAAARGRRAGRPRRRVDTYGNAIARRRRTRDLVESGLRLGDPVAARTGGGACAASSRARSPTSAPGDAAALRGRRRRAGAGRQRRRRGAALLGVARRRRGAPGGGVSLGRPRLHLRETTSTNDRARALAAPARRTARSSRPACRRRPRAPGTHVDRARRLARSCSRSCCGSSTRCSRCAPGSPSPTSPAAAARVKWPNDVLARRPQGRRASSSRARPQEGWAVLGIGVNAALEPGELPPELRGRWDGRRADLEAALAELLRALERRLARAGRGLLAAVRERDALLGQPVSPGRAARALGAGIDASGRFACGSTAAARRCSMRARCTSACALRARPLGGGRTYELRIEGEQRPVIASVDGDIAVKSSRGFVAGRLAHRGPDRLAGGLERGRVRRARRRARGFGARPQCPPSAAPRLRGACLGARRRRRAASGRHPAPPPP